METGNGSTLCIMPSSLEAQIDAPRAGQAPRVLAPESRPPVPNLQDETLMCPQTLQGRHRDCERDGYLSTSTDESEPEKDSCWTPSSGRTMALSSLLMKLVD